MKIKVVISGIALCQALLFSDSISFLKNKYLLLLDDSVPAFKKELKISKNDRYFQKAIDLIDNHKIEKKYPDRRVRVVDKKKVLPLLLPSAQKGNSLSALLGSQILSMPKNKTEVKKALVFADTLAKKGYCFGFYKKELLQTKLRDLNGAARTIDSSKGCKTGRSKWITGYLKSDKNIIKWRLSR